MTISGTAKGSDGKVIQKFTVEVKNGDEEVILNQAFTNGTYILDAIPGYTYWFNGMPLYGGVLLDGSQLKNGGSITIPENYPYVSATGRNIYYAAALFLIGITIYHEVKKKHR